jgi:aspartate carbamoyltransferase catalytic subunit
LRKGTEQAIVACERNDGRQLELINVDNLTIRGSGDCYIVVEPRYANVLNFYKCSLVTIENLTIGLCGDLKFGRTVHSLINALIRYPNIRFILISPPELRVPDYIREDVLVKNNIPFEEVIKLEEAMPSLDILYMTRVQKERFFNEEDYLRMKGFYILDKKKMTLAKDNMLVLHPLPRVNEISVEVDEDPRAAYFRQAQYGVYIRMALILTLLEIKV